MYKTTARHNKRGHHRNDYDLYGDLAKIKDALADATYGIKDHAGEVLSQSFDTVKEDVREKSVAIQEYVSDKPFKSIGVALLAGVCLGYFIRK